MSYFVGIVTNLKLPMNVELLVITIVRIADTIPIFNL